MHLIDTIEFPLKIWHAFGFSTFQIGSNPSVWLSYFRKIYTFCLSLFQLYTLYCFITIFELDRRSFAHLLVKFVHFFFDLLLCIIIWAIFIESVLKRNGQKEFLHDIMAIELYQSFEQAVGINLEYPVQKCRNIQRFIRWVAINLVMGLLYPAFAMLAGADFLACLPNICRALLSLHTTVRFYQYTTFVDMLNWRYSLINKQINDFYAVDFNQWPLSLVRPSTAQQIENTCRQINDLRMICRQLNLASRSVNGLFSVSLSLCIFRDFCGFFFAGYGGFKMIFLHDFILYGCIGFGYSLASANNLISMAVVCDQAATEV